MYETFQGVIWFMNCPKCGSRNIEIYDDGEGYPVNIECKDCDHWWDSQNAVSQMQQNPKHVEM